MNNKGISLVTVVVIIIVMIIVATISIVAGNKLIFETDNLKDMQNIQTIRQQMDMLYREYKSSGVFTPKGEGLIGRNSPAIANGNVQATGWYLLDEDALKELGAGRLRGKYLVNYEYSEVLDMSDPRYFELYNVVTFMYSERARKELATKTGTMTSFGQYVGEELNDKTSSDDSLIMYKEVKNNHTELYGDGWFYVTPADYFNTTPELQAEYADIVTGDYLINYDDAKYVLVTASFERVP